jgi:lysophospholipase L1-like esterase
VIILERKVLLALGDSITAGWPYDPEVSWVETIKVNSPHLKVINQGISGDTFADMLNRFKKDVSLYKPDYCIIMGGTNEAYLHISQNVLKNNFLMIIDELNKLKSYIIVGIPLPVDDIPMEEYLRDFRQWLNDYCQTNHYPVINFYKSMVDENKKIKSHFFLDGCHPNKEGYKILGQLALKRLQELKII